jgi:hypothetical protein
MLGGAQNYHEPQIADRAKPAQQSFGDMPRGLACD